MKIIGLDVGERRIGIAVADATVRIAIPDCTIEVNGEELEQIYQIAKSYRTMLFVIGMPRNVAGQETAQSRYVRQFAAALQDYIPEAKVKFQDETLTSVEAEKRLQARKRRYQKAKIDAEAAAIILQDFIESFGSEGDGTEVASVGTGKNTGTGVGGAGTGVRNTGTGVKSGENRGGTGIEPKSASVIVGGAGVAAAKNAENAGTVAKNAHTAKNVGSTSIAKNAQIVKDAPVGPVEAPRSAPKAKAVSDTAKGSKESSVRSEEPKKKSKGLTVLVVVILCLVVACGVGGFVAYGWYNDSLTPVIQTPNCDDSKDDACRDVEFTIADGESSRQIGDNLQAAGLIRSSLAFQLYLRFNDKSDQLKTGTYHLKKTASVQELVEKFIKGEEEANVFRVTFLPGDTLKAVKQKLVDKGYTKEAVDAAFAKKYEHPVLQDKPEDASLEGYIYGETYEFYKGEAVENIIETALNQLYKVVQEKDLINAYKAQGLNLYQGITLASIVQKEAKSEEQPTVAQVFLTRLSQNMVLGSDVTTQYALDLIDPDRKTYTDNSLALEVDSPYNTRKYAGLPPGPISNPGQSALLAVAHPTSTSYLYFLTGDDGVMYYSNTEAEHQRNVVNHCKEMCSIQL